MTINLKAPELRELKPHIMVCGVGGAGGNAVNNMIVSGLIGVEFIVANTDAQALTSSKAERIIQMGLQVTEGLGAGSQPEVGRAAAEEAIEEIRDHLSGAHMVFVTAGMGGGTGTGAAPVIARAARDMGILTVGVVTKPFQFEGARRMRVAEMGITELQKAVDTLIIIPNQNLFRIANEKTTFADAFSMADQVLYSGVACITDLMVKEGLINLDFADVRAIMREMGKAMMGTGEASGDKRAMLAAEAAIANPLLDEVSMKGARGLLISITGGNDLTLYEVDEAAGRIRQEVDEDANIILGATFDASLDGIVRVSVVATGIDQPPNIQELTAAESRITEVANRLRAQTAPRPIEAAQAAYHAGAESFGTDHDPRRDPRHDKRVPQAPAQPYAVQQGRGEQGAFAQDGFAESHPYAEGASSEPQHGDYYDQGPFIPGPPEQPIRRQRMPQIDDLPLPGQNQLRARRGEAPVPQHQEAKQRRSLLERLASFGASRQDEPAPHSEGRERYAPAPHHSAPREPQRPQAPGPVHAEYGGKRSYPATAPQRAAQVSPEPQGRPAAYPARSAEEDQLEIPAFLRRQSS
jgi:cell division protein FtsZ